VRVQARGNKRPDLPEDGRASEDEPRHHRHLQVNQRRLLDAEGGELVVAVQLRHHPVHGQAGADRVAEGGGQSHHVVRLHRLHPLGQGFPLFGGFPGVFAGLGPLGQTLEGLAGHQDLKDGRGFLHAHQFVGQFAGFQLFLGGLQAELAVLGQFLLHRGGDEAQDWLAEEKGHRHAGNEPQNRAPQVVAQFLEVLAKGHPCVGEIFVRIAEKVQKSESWGISPCSVG